MDCSPAYEEDMVFVQFERGANIEPVNQERGPDLLRDDSNVPR